MKVARLEAENKQLEREVAILGLHDEDIRVACLAAHDVDPITRTIATRKLVRNVLHSLKAEVGRVAAEKDQEIDQLKAELEARRG